MDDGTAVAAGDKGRAAREHATDAPAVPELSVIIPAYNEGARMDTTLDSARRYLDDFGRRYEVVIVDDGSRDDSPRRIAATVANWPQARLLTYRPNRGKGHAVRTGVLASRGGSVLFMDADLSTPLDAIAQAVALLDSGADIVIGSRTAAGARVDRAQPRYRRWGTRLFNQLRDGLLGLSDLGDTQCGFKAYRGDAARSLFALGRIDRWMFDVELLYLARLHGLRIVPLPVRWRDERGSKLRLFRDTAHMARDLLRIRLRHRGAGRHPIDR